jgi:hypothetical protein
LTLEEFWAGVMKEITFTDGFRYSILRLRGFFFDFEEDFLRVLKVENIEGVFWSVVDEEMKGAIELAVWKA